MTTYSPMPLSYDGTADRDKLNAYKRDLTPTAERTRPCVNHPGRHAKALDNGDPVCLPCWRERHTQGAITRDVGAILRAPLDPHERYVLLRRAERDQG